MTTLFGGFPQRFYEAYNEVFPLKDAYKEREPLYQLYYLLCHLNLFGESYGGSVDSVLQHYVTS
jgi:fructosamine-3-kinase